MFNDECATKMMDFFTNPLFKMGFFDYFLKMQQEGIETARKFWATYAEKNNLFPDAIKMYERIITCEVCNRMLYIEENGSR